DVCSSDLEASATTLKLIVPSDTRQHLQPHCQPPVCFFNAANALVSASGDHADPAAGASPFGGRHKRASHFFKSVSSASNVAQYSRTFSIRSNAISIGSNPEAAHHPSNRTQ